MESYEASKKNGNKRSYPAECSTNTASNKQPKISAIFKSSKSLLVTKKGLMNKLIPFVANGILPLSVVEN